MSRKQGNSKSPGMSKTIRKLNKDSDSSSSERRYGKFWKPNEDQLLLELHKTFNGNWKSIVEQIPGHGSELIQIKQILKYILTKLRKQWTDQEDQEVIRFVNEHGRNWKIIEGFMDGRSSKQIRERFLNNLDPEINREKFSLEEDQIILEQYRIYGPKWSEIAKMLNRRPENQVKNRFYSYIKRVLMLNEKSDYEEDEELSSSIDEPCKVVPPLLNLQQPIYQPLETIQSLKEENDPKNDSLVMGNFNQTPSNRVQHSINLIQGNFINKLDSFEMKQFGGIEEQENSPFNQQKKILDFSPINFQYANHQPNFDMIQEDIKELKCQIEGFNIESNN